MKTTLLLLSGLGLLILWFRPRATDFLPLSTERKQMFCKEYGRE